jgi:3-phenylpropionate/trans-cinnamate dioxygenase ferredoxin reductase subunit
MTAAQPPGPQPVTIVVVGGGLAGVSICGDLRRLGYSGSLMLMDSGTVLHDRPPLSKDYLLGKIDVEGLRLRPDSWYAGQGIDVRPGVTVARAVPEHGYVELAGGERLPAEVVVLATGGGARRLEVPGADSARVHYLRTLADADRLRPELTEGRRVLVVGAGLIGAEIAASASALGATITLVDPLLPLEAVLGARLAEWLHGIHTEHGIDVRHGSVEEFRETGTGLTVQLTDSAVPLEVDLAVVGIGLVPETTVAAASGAMVNDGVVVDERQRATVPGLYAVGDCTRPSNGHGTLLPRPEHWEAAMHDAARAAAAILGQPVPPSRAAWFWSDRHGHHVEVVGDPTAGTQVVRGEFGVPPFAVLSVAGNRVVGAVSVNQPLAVRAARRLIDGRIPVSAEELADPSTDLRTLTKRTS